MGLMSFFKDFRKGVSKKKSVRAQLKQQPANSSTSVRPDAVWTTLPTVDARTVPRARPQGQANEPDLLRGGAPGPMVADAAAMPAGGRTAAQLLDPPSSMMGEEPGAIRFMADIPGELRDRIHQDGMARVFRRLETPLRALNMATSRKGITYPADELRGFLLMWRQALADYAGLVPDERSVLVYDRSVDDYYFVRGRCQVGAHLTIIEPCWTLNGEVVVRGEAQVVQGWVR